LSPPRTRKLLGRYVDALAVVQILHAQVDASFYAKETI
jgi:hypothetical protein